MTESQALRLGRVVAARRASVGLSVRELAHRLGVARGWVSGLENGRFLDPGAEKLAQLAEVLDIDPAEIDRIVQGAMTYGLPQPRAYFRAKYALSREEADQVVRYIERLRRRG